jgi:succinyl-CoA synthetase alpha subunit
MNRYLVKSPARSAMRQFSPVVVIFVHRQKQGAKRHGDQGSGVRNQIKPPQNHRYCEARSDVAIHVAVQLPETPQQIENRLGCHGLSAPEAAHTIFLP